MMSSAFSAVSPATGSVAACSKETPEGMLAEHVGVDGGEAAPRRRARRADDACPGARPAALGGGLAHDPGEVPAGELAVAHVG